MSGTIINPGTATPVDPIGGMQRLAALEQTQANTGMIGQQIQGAEMGNQLRRAQLGIQLPMLNDIAGGGNGAAPNGGGGAIGSPGLSTGPSGTVIPGVGAVPRMMAASIFSGDPANWNGALAKLLADKKTLVAQMAGGTMDASGNADPQAWNQMVSRAYQDGWMTNEDAQRFYGHPELARTVIASLAPPEQQPWFKGEQTLASGVATARTTPHDVMIPGPNGGMVPSVTSNAALLGLAPAPSFGSPLAQNVKANENATGNPAQTNQSGPGGAPTSSAMGDHQWTRGTWADAVLQYAPQLAPGMTRAQIMASKPVQDLRGNSALSAWMFDQRAPEIAQTMAATVPNGTPTNAAVALGHFLGPNGAQQLVHTPSDTPFKQAFPQQAAANPTYANMTTGQVAQQFARRYGTGQFQPAAGQPMPPVGAQAPAAAPGVVVPPPVGGGAPVTGVETFSEPQKINMGRVKEYQDDLTKQAAGAQQTNTILSQAMQEAAGFTSGPFAPYKEQFNKYLTDFANNVNAMAGKDIVPAPKEQVGDWEAFNKNMLQLASSAVKQMASRVTNFEFGTFQKIMPQDTTTPAGRQLIFDQYLGLGDYMQAKNLMASKMAPATTNPSQFESEWNKAVSPEAFIVHRMTGPAWDQFKANAAKTPEAWSKLQAWVKQAGDLEHMGLFPSAAQ